MELRIDRVTLLPAIIRGGATYTFLLSGDTLYLLRSGKFIDFDKRSNYVGASGLVGFFASILAGKMISMMYNKRIVEIGEYEKTINRESLNLCLQKKGSFTLRKPEIVEFDFDVNTFKLSLKTANDSFKFYFSSATDHEAVKMLVASFT